MKSYSQAGQDMFVREVLGSPRNGTYLDIGANNPIAINNTFVLEKELGWRGLLVDNSGESMEACERERTSHFYLTDAAAAQNWIAALAQAELPTDRLDYLSLDVDEASLACLKGLPLAHVRFNVITIEHDEYRRPGTRDAMMETLRKNGYITLCADVCNQGLSFEIWAVDSMASPAITLDRAARFTRSKPTEWREFFV